MINVSLSEKDIPKICDYINRNSETAPEKSYGIVVNHHRKINLFSSNNANFVHKIKKRPFSMVGIYSFLVLTQQIKEDYEATLEVYEREMTKSKEKGNADSH